MTPETALADLSQAIVPGKAEEMARTHKVDRPYLGVANPDIDAKAKAWRAEVSLEERLVLADGLWRLNIHETRLAAAKLLTQARLRPDDNAAWELLASWVPDLDGLAVADLVCIAGQKRLIADPSRLDQLEAWTTSEHLWTRRATLIMTLPWAKQNHPKPAEEAARDRVLGWAAGYVTDPDLILHKAIAWWLRDLSRHDADRAIAFLTEHGAQMKPLARKEALSHLGHRLDEIIMTPVEPPEDPLAEAETVEQSEDQTDPQSAPQNDGFDDAERLD